MHRIRRSAAALAAVLGGGAALAAPALAAPVQQVFSYTGTAQNWTVPAGVTQATFTLQGAAGANAGTGLTGGGFGAEVRATLPVTPGETLQVLVGGQGALFNGGGAGGTNGVLGLTAGGDGGGATDVRTGPTPATRLLVAGGGGGGGGAGLLPAPNGTGGAGGSAGQSGFGGSGAGVSTGGGGGQTALAGAIAAAGGVAGTGTAPGVVGGAGASALGGAGSAQPASGTSGAGGNGGGGGGGWIGGGGGGAGGSTDATADGAGGGGGAGGQNYSAPTATNVTSGLAGQLTNGVAVVSYEPLVAPEVRTQPTLSGVAVVGRTLTCELGSWSGSPALTVAWLRDGRAIAGATSAQYTLVTADAGQQVACQVTATNAAGTTLARTPAIAVPAVSAPVFSAAPSVTGSAVIGARLTCGAAGVSGTPTLAYAWLRNGRAITGATQATYAAVQADAGQVLQCSVSATANGLTAVAQSAAFGGPARLIVLTSTALVSRSGAVTVPVACFGPTACRITRVTVSANGQVLARSGARTVRANASSRIALRLGRRGLSRLRSPGSSLTVRFVGVPTGGYGGNARAQFVALKGTGS